jgi:hypothetical protein
LSRSGKNIILISGLTAFISMFLGWAELFFFKRTGGQQGLFFLLMFWFYPGATALFSWPMSKKWGMRVAAWAVITGLAALLIIANKSILAFDVSVGSGAWLFFASTIALWLGVYKYTAIEAQQQR